MAQQNETSSLRNAVTVLRRRLWIVAFLVAIAAATAFVLSFVQDDTYKAETSMRFLDPEESYSAVGLFPRQGELPQQTSAQGAEFATSTAVLQRAINKLGLDTSVETLREHVSSIQEPASNLVTITAEAASGEDAARLANGIAEAALAQANADTRKSFAEQAADLREQANSIPIPKGNPNGQNEQAALIQEFARQRQILTETATKFEALSKVAVLGEVMAQADVPSSPASPKPVRSAVIGGVVGLFISLVLVGIIESLDRRLREVDQAEEVTGMPMLATVVEGMLGKVPISGTPGDEHAASMNAFRLLRTNLRFLDVDNPPVSVLVTSSLAEEGKTTVAMGMALAAAAGGDRNVLLVEADLHRPVHAQRLGINDQPGLSDYLSGSAEPGDVVQTLEFVDPAQTSSSNGEGPVRSRLACITAGSRTPWPAELIGSERFKDFLDKVNRVYDLVILDSPPLLGVPEATELASQVDAVVFCARLGRTTADQARAGREALDRLPKRPMGLVATGVSVRDQGYYAYAYSYGAERFITKV